MKTEYKVHLMGSLISTICGKGDDEVPTTYYRNKATCKTCLKYTSDKYPNK